jgi:hypothetical protein
MHQTPTVQRTVARAALDGVESTKHLRVRGLTAGKAYREDRPRLPEPIAASFRAERDLKREIGG